MKLSRCVQRFRPVLEPSDEWGPAASASAEGSIDGDLKPEPADIAVGRPGIKKAQQTGQTETPV